MGDQRLCLKRTAYPRVVELVVGGFARRKIVIKPAGHARLGHSRFPHSYQQKRCHSAPVVFLITHLSQASPLLSRRSVPRRVICDEQHTRPGNPNSLPSNNSFFQTPIPQVTIPSISRIYTKSPPRIPIERLAASPPSPCRAIPTCSSTR